MHYCQVALAACNETCGAYEAAFWQQQGQLRECHVAYKALNTDYRRVVNELSAMASSNLKLRYELDQAHKTVDTLKLKVEEPCPHLRSAASPTGTRHRGRHHTPTRATSSASKVTRAIDLTRDQDFQRGVPNYTWRHTGGSSLSTCQRRYQEYKVGT